MADINIGQLTEAINDKADRDLNNTTRPYVVEQYDDGNGNGYRVWSNKWCEQYGVVSASGFITFPKEYRDKNFFFGFTRHYESKTASRSSNTNTASLNTVAGSTQYGSIDGIGVYVNTTTENGCNYFVWTAKGYIL